MLLISWISFNSGLIQSDSFSFGDLFRIYLSPIFHPTNLNPLFTLVKL
ncbi:hypothetical protein LEP1GSC107_0711 [Leptospira interrogans serovar Grippotyphosa str. UI 12769]|uniref:Uncharacterized protein n=1 Tax=Leptospira interrogans str. UI 12758 TaxID=1049938 RepID=A0A0E2D3K0_LEPIR|nr:hypothetical protein LEP1GSC097_0487 [Leptospira interrogans serovar Grippotyphosa str. UI 08368]EKR54594.1 hypothetical protein LEP1GSC105_0095 [Leptospira interrogans str. UI 12758]EMN84634.1 hypothetical protein LEP1GSC107_0711 [Leptospira interrogans serovar Grippotyphosa str. UI 12769]